jgi:hypothetical protein
MVNLHGASIGADLDCGDGQFIRKKTALEAEESKISGSVWLSGKFKAAGMVILTHSTIGGNLNCTEGQFIGQGDQPALFAVGANISGSVLLLKVQAQGGVSLSDATIGGNLDCTGGKFDDQGKANAFALKVERANINGSVWLGKDFLAKGPVTLYGASIGGDFECGDGRFNQDANNTSYLNAQFTKINGSVDLNDIKFIGRLDFQNSQIANTFSWLGSSPTNAMLDLRLAKVGTLTDDTSSWPAPGQLFLQGFVYDRIRSPSPVDAKNRIAWLDRQPTNVFLPQPYEQLTAVFRNMGLEDEAVAVIIAKNKGYAASLHWFPPGHWSECFWYKIFGRFVGYGYKTWRAFGLSLVFIGTGCLVFGFGRNRGLILPTDEKDCGFDATGTPHVDQNYPAFSDFIYSLEMFVPLVKLGMDDNWRPYANRRTKIRIGRRRLEITGKVVRWYLWLHILAGWALTTLWVGGLTGLVKT